MYDELKMYNELKKFFVFNRSLSLLQAMFLVIGASLTITAVYASYVGV